MPDEKTETTVKELEIDGFKFTVNTDLLDDVDALELIDQIESNRRIAKIVPLITFLIGEQGYKDIKAHYVQSQGRLSATKLTEIYKVIIDAFNPKALPSSK